MLESIKKKKKKKKRRKCITARPKREKQVTDHSTGDKNQNHDIARLHYSFNCNFFSYNSNLLSNCDLTDIGSYSFHSFINFDMHDRF